MRDHKPSQLQKLVEDTLARRVGRFDAVGRLDRIRAALIQEIVETGYADASMAGVARRAGVSTATVYRDFKDKNGLLATCLEFVIPVLADNMSRAKNQEDPVRLVEELLNVHGEAFADPYMGWLFRLYINAIPSGGTKLSKVARAGRAKTEAFWSAQLSAFEDAGLLRPTDHMVVINLLLGAIERRTVLARLAFGEDDQHEPAVEDVSHHAARALFAVFGTADFFAARKSEPDCAWWAEAQALQAARPASLPDMFAPGPKPATELQSSFQIPSARFARYAETTLSEPFNRLDAQARKRRVQVAALLECQAKGYDEATMASVARRAGVSTATLYRDYGEKRDLFSDALGWLGAWRVDQLRSVADAPSNDDLLTRMLASQAKVLADPDFIWLHRATMASQISEWPPIIENARKTRANSEQQWLRALKTLEDAGRLQGVCNLLCVNMLLGAAQRRTVLALVLFGADDSHEPAASVAIETAVEFMMRLHGTAAYWQEQTQRQQPSPASGPTPAPSVAAEAT